MRRAIFWGLLLCLTACQPNVDDVNRVTRTTEAYYKLLENDSFGLIPKLFSESFFVETDTSILINQLKANREKHGKVIGSQLVKYSKKTATDHEKNVQKLILFYQVAYEDHTSSGEEFRFYYSPQIDTLIDGMSLSPD